MPRSRPPAWPVKVQNPPGRFVRWTVGLLAVCLGHPSLAAGALTASSVQPVGPTSAQFDADWTRSTKDAYAPPPPPVARPVLPGALPGAPAPLVDVIDGPDPHQTLDVYFPVQSLPQAPVLVLVHGGAWRLGDKRAPGFVAAKARHWAGQGFVVVSVGYRLLPEAGPLEQARDVARAVAFVQTNAAQLHADPSRLVLMGHSSGAHLVALLTASPSLLAAAGAQPVKGAVLLDSAALDVPAILERPHLPLYDAAFGTSPSGWTAVSPAAHLVAGSPPVLLVCSTQRPLSCPQANGYAQQVLALGGHATVVPLDRSHEDINGQAGLPGDETTAIDRFLGTLGL